MAWVHLLLGFILVFSTRSEVISERVLDTGFFGVYVTDSLYPFFGGWVHPFSYQPYSPIGFIFKNSNNNQALIPSTIISMDIEIYQNSYWDSKTAVVSVDLSVVDYVDFKWNISYATMKVMLMQDNEVVSEKYCYGRVEVELYAKPNGNAQVKIESNNYSDCYVRLESQTLPFYMKPTMFYSYFAMVLVIIIIQLTCAVKLINWNDRQLVSITRISLMSMTGCFVVTSYRAYNLVSSLTGYKQVYYITLFIPIMLLLFWLLRICRRITTISMFQSSKRRKIYYFGLLLLFLGYNYVMIHYSLELWAQMMVPLTCYLFQSITNYQLRGTESRVYYSYYIGLLGTQFIEPLYMYACPRNIYLLETSSFNTVIWIGVFVVGSLIMGIQFKFFFKAPVPENYRRSVVRRYEPMPLPQQQVPIARPNIINQILAVRISMNRRQEQQTEYQMDPNMEIPECTICCYNIDENTDTPPVINTSTSESLNPMIQVYAVRTGCNHFYHGKCLTDWMKKSKTCPLCRREIAKLDRVIF